MTTYQHGFSRMHSEQMHDAEARAVKAGKSLAILRDALGELGNLSLLDIGASTGLMTTQYAREFGTVVGVDIDEPALQYARAHCDAPNVTFVQGDAMDTGLPADSFDAVTCTHIYEHVPDADRLLAEIYRVLRPGGACFLAAGNRYMLMEPHYRLPLLSAVPKSLAHRYIRWAGKADTYYESHRSLRGLREMVRAFEVSDYTGRVVSDPERFSATDVVRPGTWKQRVAVAITRYAYPLAPVYLWILRKPAVG